MLAFADVLNRRTVTSLVRYIGNDLKKPGINA